MAVNVSHLRNESRDQDFEQLRQNLMYMASREQFSFDDFFSHLKILRVRLNDHFNLPDIHKT